MTIDVHTEQEFHKYVNDRRYKATIVKFSANWCPPCKLIKPFYDDLSHRHADIQFLNVDVDNLRMVAALNDVHAMPTFLVFKNGVRTQEAVLGAKQNELEQIVKKYSHNIDHHHLNGHHHNHHNHNYNHPIQNHYNHQHNQYRERSDHQYNNNLNHNFQPKHSNDHGEKRTTKTKEHIKTCVIL